MWYRMSMKWIKGQSQERRKTKKKSLKCLAQFIWVRRDYLARLRWWIGFSHSQLNVVKSVKECAEIRAKHGTEHRMCETDGCLKSHVSSLCFRDFHVVVADEKLNEAFCNVTDIFLVHNKIVSWNLDSVSESFHFHSRKLILYNFFPIQNNVTAQLNREVTNE